MKRFKKANTVLVVDAGGRGASLVDAYAQSPHVVKILAIPGNDLMSINTDKPVQIYPNLKTTSIDEIIEICQQEKVDLVDVAQDNAVAVGLVDEIEKIGIPVIGPTKAAGQIEWDKAWAREFGKKYNIPQPEFLVCQNAQDGIRYINAQPDQRWFIKASGLAEGKGALPARSNKEALDRIQEMTRFKDAGETFLVEKWIQGDTGTDAEEFSLFAISDGNSYQIIGSAQDHKRANNFDEGENTGGMGCSSPPLAVTDEIIQQSKREILDKVINGLSKEGRPYKGILYLGGTIVQEKGKEKVYVVEFNARWGDPEAQVLLPGLQNDLFEVSMAVVNGKLDTLSLQVDNKSRVVITGASKGYPIDYLEVKGKEIFGIDEVLKINGVKFYGAGIKKVNGKYYANGGRLFYIVGEGDMVIDARKKAYEAMSMIYIEDNNLHYRTDIGWRDVQRIVNHQNL